MATELRLPRWISKEWVVAIKIGAVAVKIGVVAVKIGVVAVKIGVVAGNSIGCKTLSKIWRKSFSVFCLNIDELIKNIFVL